MTISAKAVISISTIKIMNKLTDANLIFKAGTKAIESSKWKYKSQEYEINQLLQTALIQEEIESKSYRADKGNSFVIDERGKTRNVTSIPPKDKAVNHLLCDEILTPVLDPFLIHDNGASREGKGVSFHRRRFEQHLREYYRKYGNEGYILLGDFKSYYASIESKRAHKMAMDYLRKSNKLTADEIDGAGYLLHQALGDELGINIGGQPSQNIGILYATYIDQYVKTVKGFRGYARYSDDFYCLHPDKEVLKELQKEIEAKAREIGLTVHPNKTHLAKLDRPFTHLQIRYKMTESGKVVKRINPKTVTRERRKLKAYKRLLESGRISEFDIENNFKSWMYQNYKVMSRLQIQNIYSLYIELYGKEIAWKKSKLRYLTTQC